MVHRTSSRSVAGPRVRLLDLEQELLRDHSKRQRSRLVRWVGNDASRFAELMRLFLKGDFVIAQRAAWVVSGCVDQHHDLARPWLRKMLRRTQEDGVHDAVRRNVLGLLRYVDIPGPLLGEVATVCFDFLAAQGQPIAVRAFSMVILGNIAQREPGLKSELRLLIEQNLPYGSAAFAACARKVLKQMG